MSMLKINLSMPDLVPVGDVSNMGELVALLGCSQSKRAILNLVLVANEFFDIKAQSCQQGVICKLDFFFFLISNKTFIDQKRKHLWTPRVYLGSSANDFSNNNVKYI